MTFYYNNSRRPQAEALAQSFGNIVFLRDSGLMFDDGLTAHEYIHVLYGDQSGMAFWVAYAAELRNTSGFDPKHKLESLAYLWQCPASTLLDGFCLE